ncbi:MAG: hypothetical protein J1F11_09980 [Oscillospiraceae bacterium]|nr:hypothetical protein [Oscillospiraceae bacterium]
MSTAYGFLGMMNRQNNVTLYSDSTKIAGEIIKYIKTHHTVTNVDLSNGRKSDQFIKINGKPFYIRSSGAEEPGRIRWTIEDFIVTDGEKLKKDGCNIILAKKSESDSSKICIFAVPVSDVLDCIKGKKLPSGPREGGGRYYHIMDHHINDIIKPCRWEDKIDMKNGSLAILDDIFK